MLNESQQKPKPRRQHRQYPQEKRQDETNDVQIEITFAKGQRPNAATVNPQPMKENACAKQDLWRFIGYQLDYRPDLAGSLIGSL